jgi:hypothetical protein
VTIIAHLQAGDRLTVIVALADLQRLLQREAVGPEGLPRPFQGNGR